MIIKRQFLMTTCTVAVVALLLGTAFVSIRPYLALAKPVSDPAAKSPVATVVTALAVKTRAPVEVLAWGDIAPAQTLAVSFSRPGQLADLSVIVGQRVAKGARLARLAADPSATAALEQARSASALADGEVKRTQELFALQLATSSQVDTVLRVMKDARSALDAQQALGIGSAANEATAPFDGVVLALTATQGDRLAAGAPVLQLGRADRLRAMLGLEPSALAAVHLGDTVTLIPSATQSTFVSSAKGVLSFQGRITSLQGLLDPKTQLINAVVTLSPDVAPLLVAGMRVQARIITAYQDGWSLPRQAVLTDDHSTYIFTVTDKMAKRLDVQKLSQGIENVVIGAPIAETTRVVSIGNYELTDGMSVIEKKQ